MQIMFNKGAARSTVNAVRSMLSTFLQTDDKPFGEHPMVTRLLRGIANLKPGLPRYDIIWDPEHLLAHLKAWGNMEDLVWTN